jgi:hypothetical protein
MSSSSESALAIPSPPGWDCAVHEVWNEHAATTRPIVRHLLFRIGLNLEAAGRFGIVV